MNDKLRVFLYSRRGSQAEQSNHLQVFLTATHRNQRRRSIDSGLSKLASLISAHGGEFLGLQEGPRGVLVMFTDPATRSTLALPQADVNAESLSQRLRESRESYAHSLSVLQD